MFGSHRGLAAVVLAVLFVGGCVSPQGVSTQDKRQAVLQMRSETLAKLYELESYAKARIGKSVGYAVFSNVGVNLILLSTASGYGVNAG